MSDATKLANRIQKELFGIGSQWANVEPGPFVDRKVRDKVKSDLRNLQELIFTAIGLSNFDLSIAEVLIDTVVAGLGCMLVQRGNDQHPIIYQSVSQAHVAVRDGPFGFVDAVSQRHSMKRSTINSWWPDAKLPPHMEGKEDDDPEVTLISVTYYHVDDAVWYYDVIATGGLKDANGAEKLRITERQYAVSPWVLFRWSKSPGEAQGRSLVMEALPDARVLSAVKEYMLRQAALSIYGVFLIRNDGVVNPNNVRIYPGARIPVRSTGGSNGASVEPLRVGGDMQLANMVIEDLTNSIHRIMLNTGIPEIRDGVRTATEWIERLNDLQQSLGAPFARILKEGATAILEATTQVLAEIGVLQLSDRGFVKFNSGEIKVKFTSPLVNQQAMAEVEALVQAAEITRGIAGEQGYMLTYKVEGIGKFIADKLGVHPELLRSVDEKQKIQAVVGQLAAMQAQQAANQNVAVQPQQGQGGVNLAA